ncbi:chorismate mutase [Thermococcus onnurineus NA1]|uniref:Chorismate mutase n=1 Tax=Thermococcus onnurineus (strain NA1) TaxID=523850 RepID=B6YX15_THEON|nr:MULTISPECIES: chorismate mutase [Thermococcus]ACJ16628.1 chorismate mutase [Thermococcus onnurineus NA1]NJE47467.1 chorismate mutase [Thermococcus sp. GR7]NJE78605.1 chorismate mutase [Thermococcus sp. GR4]NJF23517.1 chorismate mutase [Thermococcus sp. GR5]
MQDRVLKIKELRGEIDRIDEEIIKLLEKRLEVAREIGTLKAAAGLPIIDNEREREVLERAKKFRRIFEAIIAVSRDVQHL